jgi:hypothetical protein
MRVILHIFCQIQGTISGLHYAISGPGQIQYNYSSSYAGLNIQLNVPPLRLVVYRQNEARCFHICCQMQPKSSRLRRANTGPSQIQYNYISWCSCFNIQLNVSPSILVICQQFNAYYTPHFLANTEHNIQLTLYHLWSRSNPIKLHFLILSHQYSNERISTAISGSSTIQCALYTTLAAKYSAYPLVYAMSTMVPVK